jgi:hypothetical protein
MYLGQTPVEVVVEKGMRAHRPKFLGVLNLVRARGRIVYFKMGGKNAEHFAHPAHARRAAHCHALLYRDATDRKETALELHHLVKLKRPKLVLPKRGQLPRLKSPDSSGWLRVTPKAWNQKTTCRLLGFLCGV